MFLIKLLWKKIITLVIYAPSADTKSEYLTKTIDSRDIFVEMIVGMGFRFHLYTYDGRDIFVEAS